jgi:cytidylate kinase
VRVIAIDGPVGSGKSSVAQALGRRLGLQVLESGAMYRALTAVALSLGVDPDSASADALVRLAQVVDMESLDPAALRTPAVNRAVSTVAAQADVRAALVNRQRAWVEARGGGVVEGRDIGTVVFPDAELKVFLTASPEERARRRGGDEDAADVLRRDHLDSTRSASPLVAADDAHVIDSTGRTVDEVVDEIVGLL